MEKERFFEQTKKMANSCPYYQLLGMNITDIREGESRIQMPFGQKLTHPYGMVHGGAIASLADAAVAVALIGMVDEKDRVTTIEFKINFFAPISKGELTARAKIIHRGSMTAVGDVEVMNEKGRLVAKAIATYSILNAQGRVGRVVG